jgi:catechol 2,3-dioxygenase-like lactoylglutathione lyase family enzyme
MGLPGLRAIEHVGLTVPDLDEAVRFFVDVMGMEYVFGDGPFSGDRDFMRERLNVHPDAAMRYCFLRCGDGANIDVFQYTVPDQAPAPPRNSDIGGHHFCFYVDDIEVGVAHLKTNGVRILGDINRIIDGPAIGSQWIYFLAPWGLQLELVSYPSGKGLPGSPARKLWTPSRRHAG